MRVHDGDPGDETDRCCVICGEPLTDEEDGLVCIACQEDVREEES